MESWDKLKPATGGFKKEELAYIGCGTGGGTKLVGSKWWVTTLNGEIVDMKQIESEDEVVYCTGQVTDYEIANLKKRIANGTTTANDVVLLERILYGKARTPSRSEGTA